MNLKNGNYCRLIIEFVLDQTFLTQASFLSNYFINSVYIFINLPLTIIINKKIAKI